MKATVQHTIQQDVQMLNYLFSQGGPEPHQYGEVDTWVDQVAVKFKTGVYDKKEHKKLRAVFNDDFRTHTIQGHAQRQPYGYAGDFEIIDKIYTHHTTDNPQFVRWDKYFHQFDATKAVRNRKEFFKSIIDQMLDSTEGEIEILNLASGPCRDLKEVYDKVGVGRLKATCIDLDKHAIAFAEDLTKDYQNEIEFINQNVVRFHVEKKFDLIWSAGLFDYFEDRVFVMVLKNLRNMLKPGGRLVIGNFSEDNPTRDNMELFGDWFLHHRSEDKLNELALQAGADADEIFIETEPLGVNLFLTVNNKQIKKV